MKELLKRLKSFFFWSREYNYRLLKERERAREAGDKLAKEVFACCEEYDLRCGKRLREAIKEYSEAEGWNYFLGKL